ncbi:MAG: hypothetical protein ACLRNQ_01145 [Flavonifractor plautii]
MTANTTASVRAFADRRWLCLISAMVICVCAQLRLRLERAPDPHHRPVWLGRLRGGPGLHHHGGVLHHGPLLFGGLIRRMSSRLCVAVGAVLFGAGLFAA